MTVAHLVFSLLCTEDIFIGALLEERDTELKFGTPWLYLEKAMLEYKQYKKDVPRFMPRFNSKNNIAAVGETA